MGETVYDYGGVGDGHVTSATIHHSATESTVREFHRDWRGRLRGTDSLENGTTSFGPYALQDIDWLGRVTSTAQYSAAPSVGWAAMAADDDLSLIHI